MNILTRSAMPLATIGTQEYRIQGKGFRQRKQKSQKSPKKSKNQNPKILKSLDKKISADNKFIV